MRSRRPAVRVPWRLSPSRRIDRKSTTSRQAYDGSDSARDTGSILTGLRSCSLGYDRAIRHRKSCVRGLQGLQIVRGEIFLPSEIVGS